MTTSMQASPREQLSRPPLRVAEACTLVIFGATGDLTRRKLLPALYDLQCLGGMSNRCEIIGTGRTRLTDEQFRDRVREAFAAGGWFWRAGASTPSTVCEMVRAEGAGDTKGNDKRKM